MMQVHRIAVLVPMGVGAVAILCTIMIHALPLNATVGFVRHGKKLGRMGRGFWLDIGIVGRLSCMHWRHT